MVKKRTTAEVKKEVYSSTNGEYELVGEYTLSRNKTKYLHVLCGKTFMMRPNDFKKGQRCPLCKDKRRHKSHEDFIKDVDDMYNGLYTVVSKYAGHDKPVSIRCNRHNIVFNRQATTVLRNRKICPRCFGELERSIQAKSRDEFIKQLQEAHEHTIELIGKYVNTHTKVSLKCHKCNTIFDAEPNAILRISGCPGCNMYHGESLVHTYLVNNNIKYVYQKKYDDLSDKGLLSYDFYLPKYNTLIEYDGKQHYEPVEYFGGRVVFDKQTIHDKMKTEYARKNNINLIRIPYYLTNESVLKLLKDKLQ